MKKNPSSYRRQFYRKPGKDYSLPGYYFITMNIENWSRLVGQKSGNTIVLNDIGNMIKSVWLSIPERFPNLILDEYIIMPDHFHAIVQLKEINNNETSIDPRIINDPKSLENTRNYIRENPSKWNP